MTSLRVTRQVWFFVVAMTLVVDLECQSAELEFFEKRIRPVLVERCYECHNSTGKRKGGLALDHRDALRRGGDSGPAIVLGRSETSRLIRALRHESEALRMPADGPKLSDAIVADFARWIDAGAVDPRNRPPTAQALAKSLSWETVRRRRMQWWSFQPIGRPVPPRPAVDGQLWSVHPVDRFLLRKIEAAGIRPAPRTDRRTSIRRLTFALTGLPPTPREIDDYLADNSDQAYERVVDRLLASPRFGERWARHWMDWVRYAESHGSEGDPAIPHAYRFRDYLIRALNADVPYDQLVKEHIAGDLLENPRIDAEGGTNESAIGVAQLRLVQHGFAPTDALEEQVRFTDNQIDVISKGFMGLTVSCARCHDHKFDAIGQDDFYAWYGVLASCRPALITIDTPERQATNKTAMADAKKKIRAGLAAAWSRSIDRLPEVLSGTGEAVESEPLAKAAKNDKHPLHAFFRLQGLEGAEFSSVWEALVEAWQASRERLVAREFRGWDLGGEDSGRWFRHGVGLEPLSDDGFGAGEFHVLPEGDLILTEVLPRGVYSHLLSSKHNGILSSPRFEFDMKSIYLRVIGDGGSKVRYSVQGYPRSGTVYPVRGLGKGPMRWIKWDVSYWKGDTGYLEISTAADQAVEVNTRARRSWFGITDAVFVSAEQVERGEVPRDEIAEFVTPLFEAAAARPPRSVADVLELYRTSLRRCVTAWTKGTISDAQVRYLSGFLRDGLLPTSASALPGLSTIVAEYRELERGVPVPTRVPGVLEADAFDQPLFVRGNHKVPGDRIPRRFLAAIDDRAYRTANSGRLRMAEDFVRPDNPFTPRVAVNRIWHHLFGRGLVATTDNFGQLGEKPSHPQLLDYLAHRFVESGWSIKKTIRLLVTSEAFRSDSRVPRGTRASVEARDSSNRFLSHFPVRRLEAEAIRDAMLSVSGELDATMHGPSVDGQSPRRSVYVRVRRNNLDPFLKTFDAPEPHTTRGRRDVTNVPAQSLAMLNAEFVVNRATAFAESVLADARMPTDRARIDHMYRRALGRDATRTEQSRSVELLAELIRRDAELERRRAREAARRTAIVTRLAALEGPARERAEVASGKSESASTRPEPIAAWEFDDDLRDSIGDLHGVARGTPRLSDGALVVDGNGHVETVPLVESLGAKTLEAWVTMRDLKQRGGGVMSVESIGGGVFDSIVFGEKDPGQWLPGSDNFRRTRSLGGPVEASAADRPVHLAITYAPDGTISAFRDGEPYGRSYRTGSAKFLAEKSVVLFGLRHSAPNPGKLLRGQIHSARLYDRALTPAEVRASFDDGGPFVSRRQILDAMTPADRQEFARLSAQLAETEEAIRRSPKPAGYRRDARLLWRDFARCLFSMKEFIYLR